MKNFKIRTKLLAAFIIVAFVAVIVGIVGYIGLINIKKASDDVAHVRMPSVQALLIISEAQTAVDAAENALLSRAASQEARNAAYKRFDDAEERFTDAWKIYEPLPQTEEEAEVWKDFVKAWDKWWDLHKTGVQMARNYELSKNDSTYEIYSNYALVTVAEPFIKAETLLGELIEINVKVANEASDSIDETTTFNTVLLLVFIIIGLIAAIILGFSIANNIENIIHSVVKQTKNLINSAIAGKLDTRANPEETNEEFREIIIGINQTLDAVILPLNVAADYVDKISKGEMPLPITDHYNGDFNNIKNNLNLLISSTKDIIEKAKLVAEGDLTVKLKKRSENDELIIALSDMVEKLAEIVSGILTGADNIADASAEVSSAAQETSQGTSEQASSVEEVTSSIEQMNANIQQNTDNALQTERIALKSSADINEANKAVEITVKAMLEIAEKITIINEIAEKTDILAINAAIEAARAGEHGKGFAVVAAEVRKLAENSQIAAKEIGEVSKRSVEISKNAGVLLSRVVPDIQNTTRLVQEIAAASSEQNAGANQIGGAVNQLNQVVQQNAASAEELSSNSEELASQAEMLKDLVSFFKLNQIKQVKRANTVHFSKRQSSSTMHKQTNVAKFSPKIDLNMSADDSTTEFTQF
ncbi:MAG TPA: methyl-accepting chemotaxis protein [Bacteroidales bacterium]|nr:methyl-accepting chemotaxis protein [Bacteroidales bacterium]